MVLLVLMDLQTLAKRLGVHPMPDDRWLSVAEIAQHLGVTKDSIYDWIDRKSLPAHRVGRLWRFKVSEVDEWVRLGKAAPEAQGDADGKRETNDVES